MAKTHLQTVWHGGAGLARPVPSQLGAADHEFARLHLKSLLA